MQDLGAQMPMRTIGMLLGIPEQDQEAIRDRLDASLAIPEDGVRPSRTTSVFAGSSSSASTSTGGADHPSDDLMTELIHSEFTDETGTVRTLTRDEVLIYIMLIAGAGNETATRLIAWTGKLLAEHPDQRREIVEDRSLVPGAIEEILRYEAPSPVQARVLSARRRGARAAGRRGEHHGAAQRVGEPGRPSVP